MKSAKVKTVKGSAKKPKAAKVATLHLKTASAPTSECGGSFHTCEKSEGGVATWQLVKVSSVRGPRFNPRQTFEAESLKELTESVRQDGIVEPLIVRRLPESERNGLQFELIIGERRLRAAKAADLDEVPVIVRDVDDLAAARLCILENLQRCDLTPMEEALGFDELLKLEACSKERLAEKLGIKVRRVYSRLRLLKLSAPVRKAVEKGEIGARVAELIGTFQGEALQEKALEEILDNSGEEGMSHRRAVDVLARLFCPLDKVGWNLGDKIGEGKEALPACLECPHNSKNSPDLKGLHKGAVCCDAGCFGKKCDAAINLRQVELRIDGRECIELHGSSWNPYGEPVIPSAYELADEEQWIPCLDESTKWRKALKGVPYNFFAGITPVGTVVDLVEVKRAEAALAAAGKLPEGSQAQAPSPQERKAVIADNKRKRALSLAVGAECAAAAAKLPADELLRLAVVCWLRGNGKKFGPLYHKLKLEVEPYDYPDPEKLTEALRGLKAGELGALLIACQCTASNGDWVDYELQEVEKFLGVRRDVIENRMQVAANAAGKGGDL